jgi:pimeloyl-ACP methyl ester carboxylesterase
MPQTLTPPGEFLTAAGVRLHYVRRGHGPAVVYVHGAKGSVYDVLLSLGDRLAQEYTLVAFDRPGSGFSGRGGPGGGAPQAQAAVLHAAATELGLERPVLVGHSLGAAVCLAWALQAPEDVAAVVTLGGYVVPLGSGGGPPPWAEAMMRSRTALRAFGAFARSPVGRPFVRGALRRVFAPGPVPEEYARLAPLLALDDAHLLSDGEDNAAAEEGLRELAPRYPGLSVPLVVVVGDGDQAVPPWSSERLHQLVPGSELVREPGAGHMPQFTTPDTVLAAVGRAVLLGDAALSHP